MKPLSNLLDILNAIAKGLGKPILYIAFDIDTDPTEIIKAAPYLDVKAGDVNSDMFGILVEGGGFIICDDLEEMMKLFNLTVGKDGPTSSNGYSGSARVYALTSEGHENT